uniref:G-protein coupled receptors family 1 profile domain-containing protein n=1 Tax=Ascaris lumbricoides TaxID=6252 RepID=A0A9J2PBS8_ASCLU
MQRVGCRRLNFSEEAAVRCFTEHFGNFYDACANRCYVDMQLTSLFHNDQLENIVYGQSDKQQHGHEQQLSTTPKRLFPPLTILHPQLFPILVFFVVVANVLVAIVLSKKHMITPTNVVLKYMAIADLCVGLVPLPWTFFYHTLRFNMHEDQLKLWWCYMYKYSMDAVPPVCHNIAMWLTVLLAGQRYISIEYPLKSRTVCSVRNVRLATLMITIASLLCGLPKSFDYYYDVYEGWAYFPQGELKYMRSCLSGFTALVQILGPNAFFNSYFWTRVLAFILLPSFLLIILNFLLIRGLRRAQKRKEKLLREKRAREAQRQNDSNSTSLMLVVIVSIFLIVNLPQAIFMGLLCVCTTFGIPLKLLEGIFPAAFLLANNMLVMLASRDCRCVRVHVCTQLFIIMLKSRRHHGDNVKGTKWATTDLTFKHEHLSCCKKLNFTMSDCLFSNSFQATYPINFGIYCFMSSSFRQTFRALFCRQVAHIN